MKNINHIVILTIILFLFSCKSEKSTGVVEKVKKQKVKVVTPKFNSDSAYHYVKKQVDFGPRVISTRSWAKCALWLEKKLLNYTPNVIVQEANTTTYDKKSHVLKNIIASFNPEKKNRIALFAHWDSRHIADHDTINQSDPILGANDGGSGVGVLIELARQFNIKDPKIGVDIILFDAEDYGQPENSGYPYMEDSWCLGSQHWSKNPHTPYYTARYGILLDMVAGKDATFYLEGYSTMFASSILQKVWKTGHNLGYGRHFIFEESPKITDDHFYVNTIAKIPTIDIIEYDPNTKNGFNKYWHTHGDDMNNIDKNTLNAVGQTLIDVIYKE